MQHMTFMNETMKKCIETCNACGDECEAVLYQHCLKMGNKHVEQDHVKSMADCIDACQTAAHFMLRGSDNHALYCNACADICEACADSCQAVGGQEMEDCAQTCRACAKTCREMSDKNRAGRSGTGMAA